MKIVYALQTCDTGFNNSAERFCCDTKEELIQKCAISFFESIKIAAEKQLRSMHEVIIVDDHSTDTTKNFLKKCVNHYSQKNISVKFTELKETGIHASTKFCYDYLVNSDGDLVYKVQDDYLFQPSAIYECIDILVGINNEFKIEPIITPYNAPYLWFISYFKSSSPRTIVPGINRYWIQVYDLTSSFLTTRKNMIDNYDLLMKLVSMNPKDPQLEPLTVNQMTMKRGYLAVCPFESLALHMQTGLEKDPYVDWVPLWNSIVKDF